MEIRQTDFKLGSGRELVMGDAVVEQALLAPTWSSSAWFSPEVP
jgi:hypothetical protein